MEILMDENMLPMQLVTKNRKRRHSENDFSDDEGSSPKSHSPSVDDDRRAHHNELERRRRDHIKDHFMALKDAIPLLEGEKSSRALILKRAIEYISLMKNKLRDNQNGMAELKRRNEMLEARLNERCSSVGQVPAAPVPRYGNATASNLATVPTSSPLSALAMPVTLPPTTISPTSSPLSLPGLDSLRLNPVVTPSAQDNLLTLTQLLLSQAKLNQQKTVDPSVVPEIQARLLANSFFNRDRVTAGAQF